MAKSHTKAQEAPSGLVEVAQQANVSTGTVSRVFNNSASIPSETKSRVLSVARELGFRPRVGVRKKQIAIVTEPPWKTRMGGYVNSVMQYTSFALSKADAGITMITEDNLGNLDDNWFDGIIGVAWEQQTIDLLRKMKNLPIVWLSDNHSEYFHTVYLDCRATGRLAGDYLMSKGHRKIAVFHETDYSGLGRADGVGEALEAGGIDAEHGLLKIPNTLPVHVAIKQMLDAKCTALWVTGEDMKVLEVNWILQELVGRKVPDDISLMGFENPGISEFMRPSLTTIASPLREISEKAVEIVLQDDLGKLQKIEMQVKLIERGSVLDLT
ncbi:MAG: LacI family DNA-binding transcriptional regulator [Planctomycetes bacterium]|nr:LacI family DNA-binding transcriptional regulator [Planctomycetota bacterium]